MLFFATLHTCVSNKQIFRLLFATLHTCVGTCVGIHHTTYQQKGVWEGPQTTCCINAQSKPQDDSNTNALDPRSIRTCNLC